MAMLAPMIILNSNVFDYHAKSKHMASEASTCGFSGCQKLYNDAADVGIYIQSHKTNAVQAFVLNDVIVEDEGDVLAWKFKSLDPNLGLTVTIFND